MRITFDCTLPHSISRKDCLHALFFADEIKRKGKGHLIIKRHQKGVLHLYTRTRGETTTITQVIFI